MQRPIEDRSLVKRHLEDALLRVHMDRRFHADQLVGPQAGFSRLSDRRRWRVRGRLPASPGTSGMLMPELSVLTRTVTSVASAGRGRAGRTLEAHWRCFSASVEFVPPDVDESLAPQPLAVPNALLSRISAPTGRTPRGRCQRGECLGLGRTIMAII